MRHRGVTTTVTRGVLAFALVLTASLKAEALLQGIAPPWEVVVPSRIWLWHAAAIELGLAAGLLSPLWRVAAWGTAVLVAVFALALAVLAKGPGVPACGCFGDRDMSTAGHVAHLGGLALLAATLIMPAAWSRRTPDRESRSITPRTPARPQ